MLWRCCGIAIVKVREFAFLSANWTGALDWCIELGNSVYKSR